MVTPAYPEPLVEAEQPISQFKNRFFSDSIPEDTIDSLEICPLKMAIVDKGEENEDTDKPSAP